MAVIKEIENSSILAIDTSILIYYMEKHDKYYLLIEDIFEKCSSQAKDFKLITSTISLMEVLVKPIRDNKNELVAKYQDILLASENVFVIMIDLNIARKAAELRAKYNFLRSPDAIQLATAISTSAEYFICNDKKLKNISEIKCLILDDLLIKV